jgi:PAS domain S-box-containing protein
MGIAERTPDAAAELRRQAEERLDGLAAEVCAAAPEDLSAVVHELRVHQIELEMQNEELLRAQLERGAEREKYFKLFDRAPVGYLTLDDTGIVRGANLTSARLLGVERQLLVGQPFSAFVLMTDRDTYYRHLNVLKESEVPQNCELRLQSVGGEPFWAHFEGRSERVADGTALHYWLTLTDIDTTVKALEAQRESDERQREILEHGGIAVAYWSPDGRLVMLNRQAVRNLGGPDAADFVGKSYTELFGDEVGTFYLARMHEVALSPEPLAFLDCAQLSGGTRWFSSVHTRVLDAADNVVGVHVYAHDVTDLKQAEDEIRRLNVELEQRVISRTTQLETVNKELEAFAYSVSHDLRAPLRAIDGFSAMVVADAGHLLAEEDLAHLQRVRVAAQRMATLMDDLLGLSRVSRRDLLRDDVDLSAMAMLVLEELRETQPDRCVNIVVRPGMRADADAGLLHVILVNLLSNAWKFTSKHEEARIEVGVTEAAAGGEHAFFVRDDGAGFDPACADHLFGAFQRLHTTAEFEGDGIGLATVQRLVSRHGGRVWAESQVEQGATFFFSLPGVE